MPQRAGMKVLMQNMFHKDYPEWVERRPVKF